MSRPHPSITSEPIRGARPAARRRAAPAQGERTAAPDTRGTLAMIAGLIITALLLQGETAVAVARFGAYGVLLSLAASIAFDLRFGPRNLLRADLVALLSLYFFTLVEFLFPQYELNNLVSADPTRTGVFACMLAFGCLALGRHFDFLPVKGARQLCRTPMPRGLILTIFWTLFLAGFSNVVIGVKFDLPQIIHWILEPRFSAPWGRERLGDWKALLHELSLLVYLVPPLAGIIMARRRHYSRLQIALIAAALAFTLFFAFSEGTRYVFSAYLVTFVIGFSFAAGRGKLHEVAIVGVAGLVVLGISTTMMLQFRNVGLRAWWQGRGDLARAESGMDYFFVDYNLHTIARIVEYFPAHHSYLGWEVPYMAVIRPIPRAIWKGKPEGMSFTTEDVIGAEGWTVAATFVGEAYMAGGLVAVALVALALGAFGGWWNRIGSSENADFGILVYSSGFFAMALSMRSIQVLTTAMLPTIAAAGAGFILLKMIGARAPAAAPASRE